jgi:hypothetical protein
MHHWYCEDDGDQIAFEGSDTVRVIEKEVKPPKPCKNKHK